MTGDVLTGHEFGKRWLTLRAGVILGIGAAETKATAAREGVWAWWLSLQQGALPGPDFRPGHRCQQSLGVRVRRGVKDGRWRASLDDSAEIHHGDPVAHQANNPEIVRNEHIGEGKAFFQFLEQVQDGSLDGHIKAGGGFVEK